MFNQPIKYKSNDMSFLWQKYLDHVIKIYAINLLFKTLFLQKKTFWYKDQFDRSIRFLSKRSYYLTSTKEGFWRSRIIDCSAASLHSLGFCFHVIVRLHVIAKRFLFSCYCFHVHVALRCITLLFKSNHRLTKSNHKQNAHSLGFCFHVISIYCSSASQSVSSMVGVTLHLYLFVSVLRLSHNRIPIKSYILLLHNFFDYVALFISWLNRTRSKECKKRNCTACFPSIMQLRTITMLISFIATIKYDLFDNDTLRKSSL